MPSFEDRQRPPDGVPRAPATARVVQGLPAAARALARIDRPLVALAWFVAATVVMTWPLSAHVASRIPMDLVDPLLNCWILAWGADHLLRFLSGDLGALSGYWHANIFHPEPLALAYSEHLSAQVLQALPIYAATRNIVLAYNVLFLASFTLSAFGAYLLVRALTGSGTGAFAAGLFYGFALSRMQQLGHLQVLSSQWMPFVFYFLRRFFDTGRTRALVAGSLALVAQNLSCGYYFLYFPPFVAAYAVYEMLERGRGRERGTWLRLAAAAVAVAGASLPFLLPYGELRQLGFAPRSPSEVDTFSADVYSYLTAYPGLRLWSWLQVWPKPEGDLFPGVVPVGLAILGVAGSLVTGRRRAAGLDPPPGARRLVVAVLAAVTWSAFALATVVLLSGKSILWLRRVSIPMANVSNVLPVAFAGLALLLVLSARTRAVLRGAPRSTVPFFVAALGAALYLSFGRIIETYGYRASNETIYGWLYRAVPGFDGLRVPSRYAMIASLGLAVLGGIGAARMAGWGRRWRTAVIALSVAFLVEATIVPLEVQPLAWANGAAADAPAGGARPAVPRSRIYGYVPALPPDAVVVELPFGQPEDEARYVFFSTLHWRRLVNGYSGGAPDSYNRRRGSLSRPLDDPDRAWETLVESGASVVILHEWRFPVDEAAALRALLLGRGAVVLARAEGDVLFGLP